MKMVYVIWLSILGLVRIFPADIPVAAVLQAHLDKSTQELATKAVPAPATPAGIVVPPPPPPPSSTVVSGPGLGVPGTGISQKVPKPTDMYQTTPPPADIGSLLKDIETGTQLKKASERKLKPKQETAGESLFGALQGAILGRRPAIEGQEEEEEEWEDEPLPKKPAVPSTSSQKPTTPTVLPEQLQGIGILPAVQAIPEVSPKPTTQPKPAVPPKPEVSAQPTQHGAVQKPAGGFTAAGGTGKVQSGAPALFAGLEKVDNDTTDLAKLKQYFNDLQASYIKLGPVARVKDKLAFQTALDSLVRGCKKFKEKHEDLWEESVRKEFSKLMTSSMRNFADGYGFQLVGLPVV